MKNEINDIISKMTLFEKARICSGKNFWRAGNVDSQNIEGFLLSDGPHGVRYQSENGDNLGVHDSLASTCFPTAACLANSWDMDLASQMGAAIAAEASALNVNVVLAPAVNIKRNPLCGRNFEYFSEDPILAGEMSAAFINGLQADGVGACIKHYAVNNQESNRMIIDAVVDERALREIYLKPFEIAIKKAKPKTIMSSYNKLNGEYVGESKKMLTDILRGEWGFDGAVISDWGAVSSRINSLKAGLDLEMPGFCSENTQDIIDSVNNGKLSENQLNDTVSRILQLSLTKTNKSLQLTESVQESHNLLAEKIALNSAVLLKNESNILPLNSSDNVVVIGKLYSHLRYQGNGSSLINASKVCDCKSAFDELGLHYNYSEGYKLTSDAPNDKLIAEAVAEASKADKVLLFVGMTNLIESEGFDRENMNLPSAQLKLIKEVCGVNKNVVIVMFGGSAVELPFIDDIKALLHMYLPGQQGGKAAAKLLLGMFNPCGKLNETYPMSYDDVPSKNCFPEGPKTVEYRESIFVGYRYYDEVGCRVAFPFGYGKSYTDFLYSDLSLKVDNQNITATFNIENLGQFDGNEIYQLYVKNNSDSSTYKAFRELKAFGKVNLAKGEKKNCSLSFNISDLAFYDIKSLKYILENGEYAVEIGASSRDIRLSKKVSITQGENINTKSTSPYFGVKNNEFSRKNFQTLFSNQLPDNQYNVKPFTRNSRMIDLQSVKAGLPIYESSMDFADSITKTDGFSYSDEFEPVIVNQNMLRRLLPEQPLRSAALNTKNVTMKSVDQMIEYLNSQQDKENC